MWKGKWVPVFAGGAEDPPEDPPKADPPAFKAPTSQDELNRIVEDRLQRERKKYEDYDDLKTKAQKLDELEAANQTEIEKERTAREAAEKERDRHKGEAESLRTSIAIEKAASKANLVDPEMAARLIDRSKLAFDDDGSPTKDSLETALKQVVEDHPILKGSRFQGGGDGGARGGGSEGLSMSDRIRQAAGRGA